jgi:hypothetical protein
MKVIKFDKDKSRPNNPKFLLSNISETISWCDVQELMVAIQFKDGTHDFFWTEMDQSMQVFILEGFKRTIMDNVMGWHND